MDNISQDKYLFIVNKSNPLTPEKVEWLKSNFNFVPYVDEDGQSFMEEETFEAYKQLSQLMRKKYHYDVDSHSAGRTDETQQKIREELIQEKGEEWVKDHVAPDGTSEHLTGLSFDLRFKNMLVPEFLRGKATALAKKNGTYSKVFDTIEKEAIQFGLILRYPKGKEEETGYGYEHWHFRYVGKENAKAMSEKNMCLEEYVKFLSQEKQSEESFSQPGEE